MRLVGVGVGPGDPELVTVKAVRVLSTADRVFVPVLDAADTGRAEATVAVHTPADRIERLVFALDRAHRERYWAAAGARVAAWLRDTGGSAAFATIGDPNVYSTFGYLAQAVRDVLPEVTVETVPGITAMQALASASGTVLVAGREPLVLLPLMDGGTILDDALALGGTVVVYKGGRHLPDIAASVAKADRTAVFGAHLGLPGEQIAPLFTVAQLSTVDGPVPYLSTVLIPAAER